jgi:plastocyanin
MKNLTKWLGGPLFVTAALLAAVPGLWAEEDDEMLEITIKDLDFKYEDTSLKDQTVVLPTGVLVSWMNVDPLITSSGLNGLMPHGVKITDREGKLIVQSPILINENSTFIHKFDSAGLYSYGCIIHPEMKGNFLVFEVKEASLKAHASLPSRQAGP